MGRGGSDFSASIIAAALNAATAAAEAAFANLDPRSFLGQQAHHLTRAQVRRVSIALAREYDLVAKGWRPRD